MQDIAIGFPPLVLIRASVALVWLYEGLWCKILGRAAATGRSDSGASAGAEVGRVAAEDDQRGGVRAHGVGDGRQRARSLRDCSDGVTGGDECEWIDVGATNYPRVCRNDHQEHRVSSTSVDLPRNPCRQTVKTTAPCNIFFRRL